MVNRIRVKWFQGIQLAKMNQTRIRRRRDWCVPKRKLLYDYLFRDHAHFDPILTTSAVFRCDNGRSREVVFFHHKSYICTGALVRSLSRESILFRQIREFGLINLRKFRRGQSASAWWRLLGKTERLVEKIEVRRMRQEGPYDCLWGKYPGGDFDMESFVAMLPLPLICTLITSILVLSEKLKSGNCDWIHRVFSLPLRVKWPGLGARRPKVLRLRAVLARNLHETQDQAIKGVLSTALRQSAILVTELIRSQNVDDSDGRIGTLDTDEQTLDG